MAPNRLVRHAICISLLLEASPSISRCRAGGVVNDGTLGGGQPGPLAKDANGVFSITPALGRQFGANLFYSLSQLNLDKGETADFVGPASVQHVLTRVTGGGASSIDGTLRCAIPRATLYLINPAGVAFGPTPASTLPAPLPLPPPTLCASRMAGFFTRQLPLRPS